MKLDGLLKEYRESLPVAPALDFEALKKREQRKSNSWWVLGLAAAACLAMIWMWPQAVKRELPVRVVVKNEAPVQVAITAPVPVAKRAVHVARPGRRSVPQRLKSQVEVEDGFVALGASSMLPRPDTFQVLRVSVSGPRLAALGVLRPDQPVSNTMTADVLLGDDGMARAIRVVANE